MDKSVDETPSEREFAAIGRFVVSFEEVVEDIRGLIRVILRKNGLSHSTMGYALTTDLSVQQLLSLFRTLALLNLTDWEDKSAKDKMEIVIKKICGEIKDAIENRNEIVHGTWERGAYAYEAASKEFSRYIPMRGMKIKHSGTGLRVSELPDIAQLDELSKKCSHVQFMLYRLHAVMENGAAHTYMFGLEKIGKDYRLTFPTYKSP